jgi:hypothetical protein
VDCLQSVARLHVSAGPRQFSFVIHDPEKVTNRTNPGQPVSLTCGEQPPGRIIIIEFVEREDPAMQTSGEVRALEFAVTSK